MINLLVWVMVGLVVYALYWYMVHSTTPESVACDECNADIGEPCRPYCIGLDTEDLQCNGALPWCELGQCAMVGQSY